VRGSHQFTKLSQWVPRTAGEDFTEEEFWVALIAKGSLPFDRTKRGNKKLSLSLGTVGAPPTRFQAAHPTGVTALRKPRGGEVGGEVGLRLGF